MVTKEELDRLASNVNPRAKLPYGFAFWSEKLQLMWLKQHQKPTPAGRAAPSSLPSKK